MARYGAGKISIIHPGEQEQALLSLPASCLRLESPVIERLHKLGLKTVHDFISMPTKVLRRRFGDAIITRIQQAIGSIEEYIEPEYPPEPYTYRLPCLEPIATRTGIEMALEQLLEMACRGLHKEGKGLRHCIFRAYRIDHGIETIEISTNLASADAKHLFGLFAIRIDQVEPGLGIEIFILEAKRIEEIVAGQQQLWSTGAGLLDEELGQLLDRLSGKFGKECIHRYLPAEHYWPERSYQLAADLSEEKKIDWPTHRPRPLQLLRSPEKIEVMAPIPDYPPMNFRYKGKLYKVVSADGPERIEQEWWLNRGEHRDYYHVEDEEGTRYWIFREGHYNEAGTAQWFLHGYFS
jgi:protein ImuB